MPNVRLRLRLLLLLRLSNAGLTEHCAGSAVLVEGFSTTYDLCLSALRDGKTLEAFVEPTISAKTPVDYQAALDSGRVLAPIDHPDPAHANVTGTGLTHLGSAAGRDKMHSGGEDKTAEENLTDSMKMFNMGLEGGKPESVQHVLRVEQLYGEIAGASVKQKRDKFVLILKKVKQVGWLSLKVRQKKIRKYDFVDESEPGKASVHIDFAGAASDYYVSTMGLLWDYYVITMRPDHRPDRLRQPEPVPGL